MSRTNAASKLYVCATAQNTDLNLAAYEALTWVEVKGLGSHGETGRITNILNYDTWDTTVIKKAKGMTDAGSPEIECARITTDAGQIILRTASAVGHSDAYAFKMVRNDALSTFYNRGIVTGPRRPHGRNEDFDLEIFTLGLLQEEIADVT